MSAPLYDYGWFGEQAGFVLAFAIGLGFGFFLERAGFGSSRKLTAVFYLRDFTVLKVMFTAIVTAMLGAILLAKVGVLDLSLVYVSPTYAVPFAVGGVLFGVGFVVGGFCPGTAVVGAVSGALDALAFLGGMVLGVLAWALAYPAIETYAHATDLGRTMLYDVLPLPAGVLAFVVVWVALGAFAGAERVERALGDGRPTEGRP